jgi:uncharacterized protein
MDFDEYLSWTERVIPLSTGRVHWFLIAAIGAGVGYLGGLFGKGGSAIATPFLALIGVPPIIALASPLPATVPGTMVAFARYRRGGFADRRVIIWSICCGVPSTIVGALLTRWIDGDTLIKITDGVIACLGLRVLAHRATRVSPEDVAPSVLRLVSVAATVGVLAGLLANSGGFLLVPLYLAVLSLPIKNALACSLAVASLLAIPGTIVHAAMGHIDWRVAVVFGLASIPLSSAGARTALSMNAARLERIYGAGLFVLGAALLAFTL